MGQVALVMDHAPRQRPELQTAGAKKFDHFLEASRWSLATRSRVRALRRRDRHDGGCQLQDLTKVEFNNVREADCWRVTM